MKNSTLRIDMQWPGLVKVISGGQTGADQAGLIAAKTVGLETGGYIAKGWRTLVGPAPWLAKYGLVECASENYRPRTKQNAESSDATIRLASNFNSAGEILTLNYCLAAKKPTFDVPLTGKNYEEVAERFITFLHDNYVSVLNVAGNGDRAGSKYHFEEAFVFLTYAFHLLDERGLIVRAP